MFGSLCVLRTGGAAPNPGGACLRLRRGTWLVFVFACSGVVLPFTAVVEGGVLCVG